MEEHQRQQVQAFKNLWGLTNLPKSGKQAAAACQQTCLALQSTLRPAPVVSQLVQQQAYAGRVAAKPRFLDVSTGIRLRYLEWQGGEDVILLLHDVAEAADVWAETAARLQERGYRVFALDLRGHGDSQWSSGSRYSLDLMAQDIQARSCGFILEKDLYTRPVAVVGCGLGAAVALALAQLCPHLVGAAVVAEFSIPHALQLGWEAAQQAQRAQHGQHPTGGGVGEPGGMAGSGGSSLVPGQEGAQAAAIQDMRQRTEAVKLVGRPEGSGSSGGKARAGQGLFPSSELMPWWGFSLLQAATFASVEECAALLCHPLANLGPESLLPLAWAAAAAPAAGAAASPEAGAQPGMAGEAGGEGKGAAEGADSEKSSGSSGSGGSSALQDEERVRQLQSALGKLQRPLLGAIRSALAMLRPPEGAGAWGPDSLAAAAEGAAPLPLRMDPAFFLTFDAGELLSRMAAVRGHLLVLRGENSPWAGPGDVARLAGLAAAGGARSAKAALVPGAGHHLVTDHEAELLQAVLGFLEGPANSCFQAPGGGGEGISNPRRPELLDLKPLPQYDTLDQAKKALGPRSIPSKAAIEAELEKLRVEAGVEADSDDEENGGPGSCQTALAKDPPDYFGFVG
ncbi:hypothetical protein N2152v2_003845 [Parachlorella kessleri]